MLLGIVFKSVPILRYQQYTLNKHKIRDTTRLSTLFVTNDVIVPICTIEPAYWKSDVCSPHVNVRTGFVDIVTTFAELVPHPPISNCGEQFVIYGTDFRVDRAKSLWWIY